MDSEEHLQWLEEKKLLDIAKDSVDKIKGILKESFDAKGEDILIIGDRGHEKKRAAAILCASYYLAAKDIGLNAKLIIQGPKLRGDKADESVIDALQDLRPESLVMLSLSNKIGSLKALGESFRTYAKEKNHRFVSTMSIGYLFTEQFSFLMNSIDVDYKEMGERGRRLKALMDAGDDIHISTKAGTDLHMNIKGKKAKMNIGNFSKPGTGGNIPCGEVYIPPKWKHVEGTVIIDGSSSYREGTQLIKTPIKLTIKKDEIVSIEGGEEAKQLEATLDWAHMKAKHPWGVRRIGELGIGINKNAGIVGATIIDEKTLGTAHIGIGSNHWFGGTIYAIIHLDQVFKDPVIKIDGKLINI